MSYWLKKNIEINKFYAYKKIIVLQKNGEKDMAPLCPPVAVADDAAI